LCERNTATVCEGLVANASGSSGGRGEGMNKHATFAVEFLARTSYTFLRVIEIAFARSCATRTIFKLPFFSEYVALDAVVAVISRLLLTTSAEPEAIASATTPSKNHGSTASAGTSS